MFVKIFTNQKILNAFFDSAGQTDKCKLNVCNCHSLKIKVVKEISSNNFEIKQLNIVHKCYIHGCFDQMDKFKLISMFVNVSNHLSNIKKKSTS
jgi:hypothetical protein